MSVNAWWGHRGLAAALGVGLLGCSDLSQKPSFDTDPRGIVNDDNGNEDKDEDEDDEDDPVDTRDQLDTAEEDTDPGGGPGGVDTDTGASAFFTPTQAFMFVEWAYDDDGVVRAHRVLGNRYPPALVVTLTDGIGACELRYNLDPSLFETWLVGSSAGLTDFTSFLGTFDLFIGIALDAGLYTPVSTCNLDPAVWTADPHAAFLGGQWSFGAASVMPQSVADELAAAGGVTGWFGAGTAVTEDQVVGGYMYVPANHPAAPPRQLELLGIAADIDTQGNAIVNGNLFVLLDAADLWDASTGPRRALIRMDCMWLFNL